jgi:nucleoside-diphosphate-sugar epimerase
MVKARTFVASFKVIFYKLKLKSMHTILGINGNVGKLLAAELIQKGIKVRGVSRRPFLGNWEHIAADVLDLAALTAAVAGSEVVYLTVGLEYTLKIWRRDWVVLMQNTIEACRRTNAKLIFVDNVYMYGHVEGTMTETTPVNPSSEKGKIRAEIAALLLKAFEDKTISGCIARAADFYGPDCDKSGLNTTVFERFAAKKSAQWLGKTDKKHSFTYVPDMAKALAILGTDDRMQQSRVWHLPTAAPALTGLDVMEQVGKAFNVPPKFSAIGDFMLTILGIFIPIMRELKEMSYQTNFDYVFLSEKFERVFGLKSTSYAEGFQETAHFYLKK